MGRKGASSGLRRKPAPRFWPIHRKEFAWIVKPSSGPHSIEHSLPLVVVLRDMLGFAKTRKEAKTIVSQQMVQVDGTIRRDDSFPVGLMDVIFLKDAGKSYRVLPSYKGLILHQIDGEEAKFKLCRIEDKKIGRNGHVQLTLHDGSNILIKVADPKNPQEDMYDTLDTVKISVPEKQILEHVKMKEKDTAIITGGKNIGKYGKIVEIEKAVGKKKRSTLVTIEDAQGNKYQTILDFMFTLGENSPLIALPEAA